METEEVCKFQTPTLNLNLKTPILETKPNRPAVQRAHKIRDRKREPKRTGPLKIDGPLKIQGPANQDNRVARAKVVRTEMVPHSNLGTRTSMTIARFKI